MTREGTTKDSYIGRSGQMAVLAELLLRRINVAVPEVDEGEDVLAFALSDPDVARIQVKTATAEPLKEEGRYAARVSVPLKQLLKTPLPNFFYIFAIRLGEQWSDFMILPGKELQDEHGTKGVGYVNRASGELQLYLSFSPQAVQCGGQSWQRYRDAWGTLPEPLRRARTQEA